MAIIDSGIASLPDITASNIVYSQDFTGSGSSADVYGHGTHVTGILAGNGNQSTGSAYSYTFKGIADGVKIINLRVLDANGGGTDSEVIAPFLAMGRGRRPDEVPHRRPDEPGAPGQKDP